MARLPAGVDRLPSGHYRGRYTGPDGRRHSTPTLPTIEQVTVALDVAKGDVARGDWLDPARTAMSVDAWFARWMPRRQRIRPYVLDKEWARYRNHIKPYLGDHPLDRITKFTVETWLADLKTDDRNPATVAKALALLKTALGPKGAMGDERLRANPCQLVQADPVPKAVWRLVTLAEFDGLCAALPTEEARRIVTVAVYTGIRWSELVGLQRADYNPLRQEITVRRGIVCHKSKLIEGPTKTGKERTIPLVQQAADALAEQVRGNPMAPDGWLFTDPSGGPLFHPHFVDRIYKPVFGSVRFHDLRHSCISWLLNGGVPIHTVQEIAGHATITTTQLYAHTDKAKLRDVMTAALGG